MKRQNSDGSIRVMPSKSVEVTIGCNDCVDPYVRGRAGFHHLAFDAGGREQINSLHEVLVEMEAVVLDPLAECPEYSPTYYAASFEDPDGMKLEVVHS